MLSSPRVTNSFVSFHLTTNIDFLGGVFIQLILRQEALGLWFKFLLRECLLDFQYTAQIEGLRQFRVLVGPTLNEGLLQGLIDFCLHTAPVEGGHVDPLESDAKIVQLQLACLEQ